MTRLTEAIIQIWPVPAGHESGFSPDRRPRLRKKVRLADLINAGVLTAGMILYPARKKYDKVATLLADGRVEVDGIAYARPSEAAAAITGKRTGGWWFFQTDPAMKISLRMIRRDYVDAMAVDEDEDDDDDDDEDEV